MKLIKPMPRYEGQVFTTVAILQFGKQIESTGAHNGWYAVVNMPFIATVISDYVDPYTWIHASKRCFFRFGVFIRKPRSHRKYKINLTRNWCPTEFIQGK
jgi:hypothetical protein